MKQRCHNAKHASFKYYGERGIQVCDVWKEDFGQFLEDMGKRPEGYTLERLDNNKGYNKENCEWVTWSQNLRNRRPWVQCA